MNYDHLFHAGNFADVVKHITLTRIMTYMQKKPAPIRIIDTHAGSGQYDLTTERALKNPEWREGIALLREAALSATVSDLVHPYLDAVDALNTGGDLSLYPGSPRLARLLMRREDRLTVMDLHPDAADSLKRQFGGDVQTKVMHLDGYEALPAQLPPKEKRGLVLIDPPFEERDEFDRLVPLLIKSLKHFATGTYAIWYPLKDEDGVTRFKKQLHQSGVPAILSSELWLRAPSHPPRLFGTGMIIVNPPYTLKDELDLILAELAPILSPAKSAGFENRWIRPAP